MAHPSILPTGREVTFGDDELIVSKTDLRGIITYANDVFCRVSGYAEAELVGQPHNLIRHPDMPACVFQLLWETLRRGQEIFAYVVNQAKDGSHYWVFAHVTCSRDAKGNIIGYHSNRRVPYPDALPKVQALYAELRKIEQTHANRANGMRAARAVVDERLGRLGLGYGQFIFSLSEFTQLGAAA